MFFAVFVGEMYPVGLCLHILPDVLWHDYCRFLAEPSRLCLGAFGFYLNVTKLAGFRSRKLWNRQAKLYLMGIPVMGTIFVTTAFKIPSFGVNSLLSVFSESQQASLYSNKGLLLPDRNIFGRQFHKNSDIQDAISLHLEKLYQFVLLAAKFSNGLLRLFLLKEIHG